MLRFYVQHFHLSINDIMVNFFKVIRVNGPFFPPFTVFLFCSWLKNGSIRQVGTKCGYMSRISLALAINISDQYNAILSQFFKKPRHVPIVCQPTLGRSAWVMCSVTNPSILLGKHHSSILGSIFDSFPISNLIYIYIYILRFG